MTATLLRDGRVLIVGGLTTTGSGGLASDTNAGAEVFDPKSGTFSRAGAMTNNRNLHTATLLNDGRVLIAGGFCGEAALLETRFSTRRSCLIPKPTVSRLLVLCNAPAAPTSLVCSRTGGLLLAGSDFDDGTAEVYDPVAGKFTLTGSVSTISRALSNATLLSSGQVLLSGGKSGNQSTTAAELYNPQTGLFQSAGNMLLQRAASTSTLLPDGRVLIIGGFTASQQTKTAGNLYTNSPGSHHVSNGYDLSRRTRVGHSYPECFRPESQCIDSLHRFHQHLLGRELAAGQPGNWISRAGRRPCSFDDHR